MAGEVLKKTPKPLTHAPTSPLKRQSIAVKMKPAMPSSGVSKATVKTVVRAVGSADLVKSAVVLARHAVNNQVAVPATIDECVAEKNKISTEITEARAAKDAAETKKKLAE